MTAIELGSTAGAGGVRLAWAAEGDGPLVLLLHGFPETRASWREVQSRLARAGYRAVAPDVRGVGGSGAPRSLLEYGPAELAADVAALVGELGGGEPAAVVGHDWGGLQAWWAAMLEPQAVSRLVVLNVAHPLAYSTEPRSLSYRFLTWTFEHPRALDALNRALRFELGKRTLRRGPVRPVAEELIDEYVEEWRRPGSLARALAKDRAERRLRGEIASMVRPISCPLMTIWGDRDPYWGPRGAHPPPDLIGEIRVEHLPDATHWVVHDEPATVATLLTEFIGSAGQEKAARIACGDGIARP